MADPVPISTRVNPSANPRAERNCASERKHRAGSAPSPRSGNSRSERQATPQGPAGSRWGLAGVCSVLASTRADMKTQIALLGCLILAGNVAVANVDCAKAPFGESVAQYGRDEFQLGMLSMRHRANGPSVPRAMSRKIDKAMRAACLAKFYGENVPRYARLGLPPRRLASESVGSIAAAAITWNRPQHPGSATVARPSGTASISPPTQRPTASETTRGPPSRAHIHYLKVTSNFPACPRKVDLKRILTAALIDKAAWPQAEASGKRHGCIELHAGERVDRVRTDGWGGVTLVRPEGHTRVYWTDTMVVR